MNADRRRWNRGSLFLALLGSWLATPANSAELKSQLGDEIKRRFAEATIEVTDAPVEFGCDFSRYITSKRQRNYFPNLTPPLYRGVARLEEPESLPQPTLVEMRIAKGFPSGERAKTVELDDSYHLAEEFTFGGFSR